MTCRTGFCILAIAASFATGCSKKEADVSDAARWWQHVTYLAADERQGRETGSPGHRQAAEYVAAEFKKLGLVPAGTNGFFQPVEFVVRRIDEKATAVELVRNGKTTPLQIRQELLVRPGAESGVVVDAPLVFAGYALTAPDAGYDDLAGLDVKGKIVVSLMGQPGGVPSLLAAHYSSAEERLARLKALGAVGSLVLINPAVFEIPWPRIALMQAEPSMDLADAALSRPALSFSGMMNAESAELLLRGSGHSFEELLQADRARKPLPKLTLTGRLRAKTVFSESKLVSDNVVARLPGSGADLGDQYVLLSAHLDHVGVGEPIKGDAIRNGAMDNASGVASLLEVARLLRSAPPRRSLLFLACTAEEKGLLGSKYFAERPTVPIDKIAANINLDMFLPLTSLKVLRAYGLHESDLEKAVQAAASEGGVAVQDDPQPERNVFIRSDQYSFIKKGVPALFLSFGYTPDSPDAKVYQAWFGERYHGPADDLSQSVDKEAAAKFDRLLARITLQVANAAERPQWREASFFRRFAVAGASD